MNAIVNWLRDTGGNGQATYGNLISIVVLAAAAAALIYVVLTAKKVLACPEGTDGMKRISGAIRTGAGAYL